MVNNYTSNIINAVSLWKLNIDLYLQVAEKDSGNPVECLPSSNISYPPPPAPLKGREGKCQVSLQFLPFLSPVSTGTLILFI